MRTQIEMILFILVTYFIIMLFMYFSFFLYTLSWNIITWSKDVRFFYAMVSVIVMVLCLIATNIANDTSSK